MIPLKDNLSCKAFPIATWIFVALNCVAFAIELLVPSAQSESFFNSWAVVPARISHAFASGDPTAIGLALLTVFTAMFMHAGWAHLIGNMVFLQAFGRAVEARLGSLCYALFYLVGGFAAWGLHMFIDPASNVPALGASGAIAAVLGAYLVLYPKAEFKTLTFTFVGVIPLPMLIVISAYWFLPVWFTSQLISGVGGLLDPKVGAGIAYFAHIGGFLLGLLIAGVCLLLRPESGECYAQLDCGCDCSNSSCGCDTHHAPVSRYRIIGMKYFGPRS